MKIKSLKKLSFLFVFALILSVIPSISVSAASYDRDFVAIKKVKLWVQNSHAYKRGEVKLYCLEGESPVLETQVKGLTKGNKYNIEVTLYKDANSLPINTCTVLELIVNPRSLAVAKL